jgi:two-component system, chemotaxis family, sensor kinase CheA
MLRSVYPKGERGLEELSGTADDRFRTMFFEEARELLLSLSERLNELERRQNDRAHCDETFREIHSLKGAASMVGLTAISEFARGIEVVVGRIRAGSLAVDGHVITTLLAARDYLATMVEAEAEGSPIRISEELAQQLETLARRESGGLT